MFGENFYRLVKQFGTNQNGFILFSLSVLQCHEENIQFQRESHYYHHYYFNFVCRNYNSTTENNILEKELDSQRML